MFDGIVIFASFMTVGMSGVFLEVSETNQTIVP